MRKKLQGFTLVELLAAMAIIAILIGLAGFGISIALRNARDSDRRKIIDNMQLVVNDYFTRENEYPASAAVSGSTIVFQDGTGTTIGDAVPFDGNSSPAASTDSKGTLYQYDDSTSGYLMCASLENGEWFDLSSGGGDCAANGVRIQ